MIIQPILFFVVLQSFFHADECSFKPFCMSFDGIVLLFGGIVLSLDGIVLSFDLSISVI